MQVLHFLYCGSSTGSSCSHHWLNPHQRCGSWSTCTGVVFRFGWGSVSDLLTNPPRLLLKINKLNRYTEFFCTLDPVEKNIPKGKIFRQLQFPHCCMVYFFFFNTKLVFIVYLLEDKIIIKMNIIQKIWSSKLTFFFSAQLSISHINSNIFKCLHFGRSLRAKLLGSYDRAKHGLHGVSRVSWKNKDVMRNY